MYFILTAYLNENIELPLEITDFYSDFINFTVENINIHAQVVSNILKSFPITKTMKHNSEFSSSVTEASHTGLVTIMSYNTVLNL